jgi:hypothetical protein
MSAAATSLQPLSSCQGAHFATKDPYPAVRLAMGILRFAPNDKLIKLVRDNRIYAALGWRFSSISLRKPSRQDFQNGVHPNSIFAF